MEQMSFLADLDRASDTRKANLCRTWKNAEANDCGVLTINRHDFVAKDGKNINAYVHYDDVCTKKSVMNYEEFHEVYLRLTGYTDEEYIQNMKRDQPSVFYARVKAGVYDEEGHRLHPEGWLCQPKRKKRKAKEVA